MRGIITPKSDYIVSGGGVMTQQNSVELKFESNIKGIKDITQNTKVWINITPSDNGGSDSTHTITGRNTTTNRWFVTIDCRSNKENYPIL